MGSRARSPPRRDSAWFLEAWFLPVLDNHVIRVPRPIARGKMPTSIERLSIIFSALVILGILTIKLSIRFGISSLGLFLAIDMLAGSDGLMGIYVDNPALVQNLGIIALALILFVGGLDTEWEGVRPVLWNGLALSTIGVVITAPFWSGCSCPGCRDLRFWRGFCSAC